MKSTEAAVKDHMLQLPCSGFVLRQSVFFSNIIDCFEIKQFLQDQAWSETCQASQIKRFAKIGSASFKTR